MGITAVWTGVLVQQALMKSHVFTETLKNWVSWHTGEFGQESVRFYSNCDPVLWVTAGFQNLWEVSFFPFNFWNILKNTVELSLSSNKIPKFLDLKMGLNHNIWTLPKEKGEGHVGGRQCQGHDLRLCTSDSWRIFLRKLNICNTEQKSCVALCHGTSLLKDA